MVPRGTRKKSAILLNYFFFLGLYPGLPKSGKLIFLCVINSSTFNYGHCSCKKNPLHPVVFSINPLLTLWVTILQCIIDIVSCCYDTCTPCIIIYIDSPWNSYLVYWCYLCSTVIIISCILSLEKNGTKCTKLTKLRDRNYVYEILTLAQLAGYYNSACSQCMKRYTEYHTVPRVSTVRIRNAVTLRLYSSEREMALHNVVPRVTTISRGSAWCIIP